jgi:hypothetical protein
MQPILHIFYVVSEAADCLERLSDLEIYVWRDLDWLKTLESGILACWKRKHLIAGWTCPENLGTLDYFITYVWKTAGLVYLWELEKTSESPNFVWSGSNPHWPTFSCPPVLGASL